MVKHLWFSITKLKISINLFIFINQNDNLVEILWCKREKVEKVSGILVKYPSGGFRYPFYEVFLPEEYSRAAQTRQNPENRTSLSKTDEVANFTRQYFECLKDECLIFDLILTMYNLDLNFNGNNFDDSLHIGTVEPFLYSVSVCDKYIFSIITLLELSKVRFNTVSFIMKLSFEE